MRHGPRNWLGSAPLIFNPVNHPVIPALSTLDELGLDGVVDVHVHPLSMIGEKELLRELEKAKVRKCVLLALDVNPAELDDEGKARAFVEEMFNAGIWDLNALEQAREMLKLARTPNERVSELVSRHPGLFLGFGSVDPRKPLGQVEETLRRLEDAGFRGLKLIPTLQFFCPGQVRKALRKILRFCERSGMVVMFHTGCDPGPWEAPDLSKCANPALLRPFIRSFGKVNFILAHAGSYSVRIPGIWFEEALELASSFSNVWLDTAAVPYVITDRKFLRALKARGLMGRVLFGSDYPVFVVGISDVVREILASVEMTDEEKARVLCLNACELLGFG